MGLDVMEIGFSIRKGLIFSIRTCYRSVRDHPFYWGLALFFIFLYRFFPSLFGLLVSFSPVLVCTAALLGTLLSFGNPNIPEIEKDDQRTHEIAPLKAAVVENDLVFHRDETLSAEAHVEKRGEVEEKVEEEPVGLDDGMEANISKVDKDMAFSTINDNNFMRRTVAIEEDPKEIPGEEQMIEEREFRKAELVEKQEFDEEDLLIGGAPAARKEIDGTSSIGQEENETPRRKIDMPGGAFSIAQDLPWKHVEGHAESCDSDSDRAESSSPDASMADIMPMLYELHPLLESEASQPPLISLRSSTAVSESSNRCQDGSAGSEEEDDNQEEEEEEGDDDDDEEEEEEEEEEAQGTQGDGTEDVVTWTEDDQKNLIDLGTLELERNQRLESLIAKRRARKIMKMEAEKNLIDLDSNDPPFSIAPISTRRNPFDLPFDSYEAMGLPPIPGSAPSVMLPRRNPFDIPYEPYEEKPNLTENSSQQEFMPFQPKDFQFRRHESFSLGVSVEPKQRTHFRPYFVTERMASEGVEYPMFQRQYSEKSDHSKVSSVPETESASSVADQEDHKTLADQELSQEGDSIPHIDHASVLAECGSQSSEEVDLVEIDPEEKRAIEVDGIDIKGVNEEQRMIHADCTSDHIECESQSSRELDSAEVYPEERRGVDANGVNMNGVDEETVHDVELHPHHSGYVASLVEAGKSEVHAVEEKYTDSSSSSSEVHEKLFQMETDEGSRDQELKRDDNTEGSNGSIRSSLTESDFNLRNRIMEVGDESQTKEPVYDSSPSEIEKTLSNMTSIQEALFYVDKGVVTSTPSIASDLQVEVSEVGSPAVLVHREDGESVSYDGSTIEISPGNERTWMAPSNLCAIDENESRSIEVTEISDHNVIEVGFSGVGQNSDDPHVPKAIVVPNDSGSSSLETELGEDVRISKEVHLQLKQDQVSLSSSDKEHQQHDANLKVDTVASSFSNAVSSEDSSSSELEKPIPLMDKLTVHPSSDGDREETEDSSAILVKSIEEANVQAHEGKDSSSLSLLTAPVPIPPEVFEIESSTAPTDIKENVLVRIQSGEESRVFENQSDSAEAIGPHVTKEEFSEEAEGIKEIDEAILSELDTVGDFSVKESGLSMDQKEKTLSLEEQESLPGLQVLGDRHAEDIEADSNKLSKLEVIADSPKKYETWSANFGVKENVPEVTESTSQVIEANSPDDANVDFKHVPESVVEKSVVVESVQSEPLPKETEVEFAEIELTNQDPNQRKIVSELPVVEARSLEDIESDFKNLNQGVEETIVTESFYDKPMTVENEIEPTDSGPSEKVLGLTATISELPVLEERSIEDIDMPSNKILGVQSTIITESFHDNLTGENSEVGLADSRPSEGDSSSTVTDSELPVLEARSLEDIDLALKELQEGVQNPGTAESFHDEPLGEKSEVGLADSGLSARNIDLTEISSELPVLEATSLEDIDLGFKQLHGGVQKPMAIESLHDKSTREETEVAVSESGQSDGEATEISSELPVVEAKSVEAIDLAFKQLHEGNLEGTILPKSVDRQPVVESQVVVETHPHLPVDDAKSSEGLEVEVKEMEKSEERESNFEESGIPQENIVSSDKASQGVKETSESSGLSTSAVRHKKAGSHKSSSSSSSSSSDSE
ncbi:uncharacterized protein LOC122088932 [Macadamia integrifolia]|uniref:uncharacterized protein LOC122088932 n=1 Tax=Macadamia integrifolia TaxID=60698 RepID=UPI001C4F87FD|nr:uncharacterized protein LOC122088932 [Macadamia integrifolia]